MSKAIHQFRFYSDDPADDRNEPNFETKGKLRELLVSGQLFDATGPVAERYVPILQLGVQSIPGTYFYLNGATEPIILGSTGIYELDMSNNIEITQLQFEQESLKRIAEAQNGYLIIDIIYEKEDA